MTGLLRAVASLSLLTASITLIRPKTGWGRLGLFMPKLFAGARIVFLSALGGITALLGWVLVQDPISVSLGLGAMAIGLQYILRVVTQSRRVVRQMAFPRKPHRWSTSPRLSSPWVGLWREPPDTPCRKDVEIGKNVQTGEPIHADVWFPPETVKNSGLGIIFLHGSGWHYADKDFGTRHFFKHLVWQGHVIIDVAYCLAPACDIFGMVADVKRAILWVKQNSMELKVHSDQIVLMGGSAGGHLALLAAYTAGNHRFDPPDLPTSSPVCAVVSYYGPTDLRAQFDHFCELPALTGKHRFERTFMRYLEQRTGFQVIPVHQLLPSLLGGTPTEVPGLYDLASPCSYITERCPPTLLLQGSHDFSGAAPQVNQLHESLLSVGAPSFLLELPGTEHGFDLYKPGWSPAAQAATYVTERFLAIYAENAPIKILQY